MKLICDTCFQEKEVADPTCIKCSQYDDDCDYCYFYETKISREHNPETYSCYGFTTTCECEGMMEKYGGIMEEKTKSNQEEAKIKPRKK